MAISAAETRRRDRNSPARKKRNASPQEKMRRGKRNAARAKAVKEGKVSAPTKGNQGNPAGKPEVDHKKAGANGGTRVVSRKTNRSTRPEAGSVTKGATNGKTKRKKGDK